MHLYKYQIKIQNLEYKQWQFFEELKLTIHFL